ncbi:carbohydrate kinase, partial [Parabacteroides distasonis]|nr:carbohydrate kinase [Parabacteroides distasonis]
VFQIDYSLASRTMAFDVKLLQWNETILKFAGVNETYFSKPVPMGTMAGEILKEVAEELNIQDSPIIVSGCHDQLAAAIGTGVFRTGMAVDGTGTVECITNIFEDCKDINKELLYKGGYAIVPFLKDKLATYAFSFTGGALLKWYRDNLANMEAEHIKEIGGNVYEHFNKQVDVTKPSGLLVLPYFAGAGTPFNDSNAKGAILGLTMNTTSSDIYRALMEGVTYEMRLNLEILSKAGININSIRATGGGASSKIWLQMKADILNKPVMSLGAAQSGTLGCVMLAGVACGFYASLEEAEKIFVKENEVYLPNEEMSKKYDQYYKEYKNIYQLISQLEIR